MQADKKGPLHGMRVLDFTNMMAGPYCTRWLADVGAEVVKVEPPEGDQNRTRRPVRDGYSTAFGHLNAGKKCIALDLKKPAGLQAALALAEKSDVVIENWSPGVAERLGVGYKTLAKSKPDLVYCSISGFGQIGPGAFKPAFAAIVHAVSGFDMAQVEYQGGDRPAKTGTFIADIMAGMMAFGAIQSALVRRERTGEGQYIDLSMMDCMMNLLALEFQEVQNPMNETPRLYTPLKTLDDFIVCAPTSQKNFENLARAVGHAEWIADPRFAKSRQREANWSQLMELIETWSVGMTGQACEDLLNGVGVPCGRFRTIAEAMQDPQFAARGSFSTVRDAKGEFLVPDIPFQMPGLNVKVGSRVAEFGEDTVAVLGELLGYTPAQAAACAADSD